MIPEGVATSEPTSRVSRAQRRASWNNSVPFRYVSLRPSASAVDMRRLAMTFDSGATLAVPAATAESTIDRVLVALL
jgi:hypothetical protein